MILEIGPRLEGHSVIFFAIQTHPSCRFHLAAEERTIKGSYMGSCVPSRDIPRYIGLYQDHKLPIDRLTSHQIEFGELNDAFDRLADGEALRQILIL